MNLITAGQTLALAVLTIVGLNAGGGLHELAPVNVSVTAAACLIRCRAVADQHGVRPIRSSYLSASGMRKILTFSRWLFVFNIAVTVIFCTDTVVVGAVSGAASVTDYVVGLRPNDGLRQFDHCTTSGDSRRMIRR